MLPRAALVPNWGPVLPALPRAQGWCQSGGFIFGSAGGGSPGATRGRDVGDGVGAWLWCPCGRSPLEPLARSGLVIVHAAANGVDGGGFPLLPALIPAHVWAVRRSGRAGRGPIPLV